MNQSPETKVLRDLVTQIERGKKPDITAAKHLLDGSAPDDKYCSVKRMRAYIRIVRQCRAAGKRVMRTDTALKLQREYTQLIAERDRVDYQTCNKLVAALSRIDQDARAGKLTKKQFDQAIKELCN